MATSIHSSLSCLLPFYTIPIFPLFKLKDFSFTCLLPFFRCTLHITFLFYSLRNIYLDKLPEAIYCCLQTYTVYDVLLMYYMCLPVFLSLVLKGSYEYTYAIY